MRRNHIITLQKLNEQRKWEDVLTLHAGVNRAKGSEALDGGAVQASMVLNFDVRYCSQVAELRLNTQQFRILYAGGTYKVTEFDDYFERHRNVRLTGVSYIGA